MALKFIWLQYFLDQAVGPGEYFLDQVNISWARWLVLQEISLSIKRDFWIHISRSLATHRLPPSLARKSVRPNVISGGQLSKCGDLLEIEIYYNKKGKIQGLSINGFQNLFKLSFSFSFFSSKKKSSRSS